MEVKRLAVVRRELRALYDQQADWFAHPYTKIIVKYALHQSDVLTKKSFAQLLEDRVNSASALRGSANVFQDIACGKLATSAFEHETSQIVENAQGEKTHEQSAKDSLSRSQQIASSVGGRSKIKR